MTGKAKPSAEAFSRAGDQYLGRTYKEMDCQQFVENCLRQVGIQKDLAGSNAWFRAVTWTGTPEECKKRFGSIPKGALLFIWADDGGERARGYKDGLGNASHIGIKTGRGKGAIHSSASKGRVCESAFADKSIPGGWNRIGLWDAMDYGEKINALLTGQKEEHTMQGYEATVYAENGKPVNLRSAPKSGAKIICTVPVGATVYLDGEQQGDWYKVNYDAPEYIYQGYMMAKFLRVQEGGGARNGQITALLDEIQERLDRLRALAEGEG